jgi:hypothetical protein
MTIRNSTYFNAHYWHNLRALEINVASPAKPALLHPTKGTVEEGKYISII